MRGTSASRLAGRLLAAGAVVGAMVIAGAAPALADPGGTSHGHSASAPGQVKKQDGSSAPQTASGSSALPGSSDHSQGTASTSGAYNQPQPLSTADQNSGGANGQCPGGPYCSTRDGSASGNGNGGGKATGKPCAGCVGKADNKNPKGQMPNGSDHNAGYECDRNHGIGRTNPAHTGCQGTTTPPACVPTAANHNCGQETPPGCVPGPGNNNCGQETPGCVPTAANHNCGQPATECAPEAMGPICGQTTPPVACVPSAFNGFCTSVKAVHHERPVQGERVVNTPPSTLPFTGSNAASLLPLGGLLAAAGLLLVVAGRRRRYIGRHRLA